MAMNSKNTQMPSGRKYKVSIENDERKDFMMLYAADEKEAKDNVEMAIASTGWVVTKVEEA